MIIYVFGALAVVLLYLGFEAFMHTRCLRRIPLRIHVNGTRGKTSVTRLTAAALRQAGIRTLAKVTGDEPLLILPDGSERKIRRRGPARIHEQVWLVRQAAALGVEAIVVECMALDSELQQVSEQRMLRATIGVITNVRPDHFEVMGDDLDAVAEALGRTIPHRGLLITADRCYFPRFAALAAGKGTRVILAESAAGEAAAAFPAHEHEAIVRAVCSELQLSLPRDPFRSPMPEMRRLDREGRRISFLNAFSANDPVSTALLQQHVLGPKPPGELRVALLCNRTDRPRRMQSFLDMLRSDADYDAVALCGDLRGLAWRLWHAHPSMQKKIWVLDAVRPEAIVAEVGRRLASPEFTLIGMGNAKGLGLEIARFFQEKGDTCR